ncbi:hypothetical protein [Sulfurospirillum multivorans]|uniref:Uncharacterized protein n=2 Tax=Sulfurospirillum multivorans TaxID=66821 RepID=A0AA86E1V8_SULMK|nr:hypothetical protein [Sulfurospirillum multivorans]AHJ12177.1 hypothetical protein SMUL_0910 [Sulfurospirillum multivorans DSM 12446]QEH05677.1 hypothetical protein SMN_0902 [Sulfurospirillum multivorans]
MYIFIKKSKSLGMSPKKYELKVPTARMKKALKELEKKKGKSFDSIEALKVDLEL